MKKNLVKYVLPFTVMAITVFYAFLWGTIDTCLATPDSNRLALEAMYLRDQSFEVQHILDNALAASGGEAGAIYLESEGKLHLMAYNAPEDPTDVVYRYDKAQRNLHKRAGDRGCEIATLADYPYSPWAASYRSLGVKHIVECAINDPATGKKPLGYFAFAYADSVPPELKNVFDAVWRYRKILHDLLLQTVASE